MDKFNAGLSRLNEALAIACGMCMCVIMLIMSYEVVLRYVFNSPTIWASEISVYFMFAAIFLAAGYTMQVRGHISVDLFIMRLSPSKRRIVGIITLILSLIFLAILVWKTSVLAWDALRLNLRSMTMLSVPLFPILIFAPLGCIIAFLQCFLHLFSAIARK